jgi:hypothetical protein
MHQVADLAIAPRWGVRRSLQHVVAATLTVGMWLGNITVSGAQNLTPPGGVENNDDGADVRGAFADSLRLLLIEHVSRIAFEAKTRRELGGNFFSDYRRSVRVPDQWGDTDPWWVNYIGHPVHGAAAGYIWLDHERRAPSEFRLNGHYWATRARATAWSAAYSLQFEIGPLSEASIGNVGMRPETTGWVDHVITPTGAFGLIVAEDALDRFLVKWLETRTTNRFVRGAVRLVLNPGRTLSNTSRGLVPWHRDGRPLGWR